MSDETSTDAEQPGRTDTEQPPPPEPSRPPRRGWLFAVVAPVVLAADIVTKIIAVAALEGQAPVRVLGGLFYLQLVRNPGAAFSMATGMTWVLTLIAVGVVIAIIWIMPKLRSIGWAVGLGLVLAGALGNLIDRFLRAPGPLRGHVVDFLSPFAPNGDVFPVFNVADSSIVCGGALIVVMALLGRDYDGTSTKDRTPKDRTPKDATPKDPMPKDAADTEDTINAKEEPAKDTDA
ncbi:signal peptidase II [Actinophytocola sp.]|uniref:signal peptidase II n=1 Tax=Actinophytocola sp. TaxID=1872138 RepID=UPI003D6B6B13